MFKPISVPLLLFLLTYCSPFTTAKAQTPAASLRLGESFQRTIRRAETHTFSVSVKQDHLLQLVVDQRGVDLVVRVFAPDGQSLGEFDSPNGTNGPEGVSLIADLSGLYRIDVVPLEPQENAASGRYEIRILDLRPATTEELAAGKNHEAVKSKGFALLAEVAESLHQIRLPETRVRAQIQAAQLLWEADEKRARRLADEAIGGVHEYLTNVDPGDQNYYQTYQTAMQLRTEVITALSPHDPELALSFLRSTRTLADPNAGAGRPPWEQELQLELSLAQQVASKDPRRALQMAEESLRKGYSYGLIDTLHRLLTSDPESAVKLAGEIADKLRGENLLKNQQAAQIVVNLLRMSTSAATNSQRPTTTAGAPKPPLLSEQKYRDLFSKALSDALSYTAPAANHYSVERNSAQTLLSSLRSMTAEMEKYAPGKAAAVEKRATQLNTPPDPQSRLWQKYQEMINRGTVEAALEAAGQAPQEIKDQLYQQVAMKASGSGDYTRARQILTDHISNPFQRQQALKNLEQQAVYQAAGNGQLEEAMRSVGHLRTPKERAMMLMQIVNQVGTTQKRATILEMLEQARGMIGGSGRAEDQEQMNLLLEIARAYVRYEPKRGFEILEPIVDQFNEMSAAAVTLNGFVQQFFQNGELMMQNGNSLGGMANQLMHTLGSLSVADFDRAKAMADRVQRVEVRLVAYLTIAQHTIGQKRNEGVSGLRSRRR